MNLVSKVVSFLFLLVFGLGLTACASTSGYTGTGHTSTEVPSTPKQPTKEDLAKQQEAADQKYGDENYTSFSKTFPDGRILHCVGNYRTVSCIPK